MLRKIFYLSILLLLSVHVIAQNEYFLGEPKVFNGGLILGANFTQVDGDSYYGYHKVGLNTGGVVYVHLTHSFGLSMELLYSQKGSRGEDITGYQGANGTYVEKYFMTLNYVEVPVTLHLIYHRFDVEAGVSYAYLIKSSEWVETYQPVVIDPVLNRFNTTDLDYVFGISRRLYKKLYVNARFQYSITSIRSPDRIPLGYGYGSAGQFNNQFNLRLMYLF